MNIDQLEPSQQQKIRAVCIKCLMYPDCVFAVNGYRRGEPCRALQILLEHREVTVAS
ncbi:MAG: hypothetical protein QW057_03410 [Candidatus Bathyarchaeia archaeon]